MVSVREKARSKKWASRLELKIERFAMVFAPGGFHFTAPGGVKPLRKFFLLHS